jgi:hypothetical protein
VGVSKSGKKGKEFLIGLNVMPLKQGIPEINGPLALSGLGAYFRNTPLMGQLPYTCLI